MSISKQISFVQDPNSSALTVQSLTEQITVFGDFQRPDRGTENLNTEPLQHTHLVQLNTNVQGTLASESEQNTVRSLLLENVGDIIGSDGQEVDLRSEMMRRLDSSNVRVDEDRVDLALLEGFDSLGSCMSVANRASLNSVVSRLGAL